MSPRSSSDVTRNASYGRGGAGNIGKDSPNAHPTPTDLVTPTLKSDHYTTGRGGTGNMARNDAAHPEIARAAQDVDAPRILEKEGPHHYGRGGAANVSKKSDSQGEVAGQTAGQKTEEGKGLVEKGKEFLGKLGKK